MQYETIIAIIMHIIDAASGIRQSTTVSINDPYECVLSEEWFITDPQSTNSVLRWPLNSLTYGPASRNFARMLSVDRKFFWREQQPRSNCDYKTAMKRTEFCQAISCAQITRIAWRNVKLTCILWSKLLYVLHIRTAKLTSVNMFVYRIKCDSYLEIGYLIVICLILKLSTYQDC